MKVVGFGGLYERNNIRPFLIINSFLKLTTRYGYETRVGYVFPHYYFYNIDLKQHGLFPEVL